MRMISSVITLIVASALAVAGTESTSKSIRPNILVLISDDHSADDPVFTKDGRPYTPALDAMAVAGAKFMNAYAGSPQCSPSRAAIITGRSAHSVGASRLHSALNEEFDTVIESLKQAGYFAGAIGKVHLGEAFQSRWDFYGAKDTPVERFLDQRPKDRSFFLWVGFDDPHRPYDSPSTDSKHDPSKVSVPGFLPDTAAVREDLVSYADEVARMDSSVAKILLLLEQQSLAENTLVVFTGDNGMPFPGAKGSLYDSGVHVPLILRWPGRIPPGQKIDDVVSLLDLAPTWIEVAGAKSIHRMEGQSLIPLVTGSSSSKDRSVFFERNWHDNLDLSRGIRSTRYLLIQNYRNEVGYDPTLDLADSPAWKSMLQLHQQRTLRVELERKYFSTTRPEVELYDLQNDPYQLHNLADDATKASIVKALQEKLSEWMVMTNDFLPPPIPPPFGPHGE